MSEVVKFPDTAVVWREPPHLAYRPRPEYAQHLGDGPRQFPALYYFAGTGPAGETCGTCEAFLPATKTERGRCRRWVAYRASQRLVEREQHQPGWWSGLPCIDASTPSCRYWVAIDADL